jgi:hypothetical protein
MLYNQPSNQEWVRARPTWEVRNIKQALAYFAVFNTPAEAERLRVASDELRRRARREHR